MPLGPYSPQAGTLLLVPGHMRTIYSSNRRGGHSPAHVRDTFLAALNAYRKWQPGDPEPFVECEVRYEPRPIPITRADGLEWDCSDL